MTDNEKRIRIAKWVGHFESKTLLELLEIQNHMKDGLLITSDYLNDDAAAMSLLDTLVEKGYWFTLDAGSERYVFNLRLGNFDIGGFVIEASGKTRREAVVAAVLELISKEP